MTAKMIFQKFQSMFPDFAENVEKYKRIDANQISMSLKTGGTCLFRYSKNRQYTEFYLNGKIRDVKKEAN